MGWFNSNITEKFFKGVIEQYFRQGFSFIPVKYNSKEPLISWRKYQNKSPDLTEVDEWINKFEIFNIGIITGYGGFYSLDIDNAEAIKELPEELLKELLKTAITQTRRGYHINFLSDKKLRTKKLKIKGVELEFKGIGAYVIEYPSIVNDYPYKVINPITQIKRLPSWLEELIEEQEQKEKVEQGQGQKQEQEQEQEQEKKGQWVYNGKAKCIRAILDKELLEGERHQSLYILYNLLLKHNPKQRAMDIVRAKNRSLKNPLPRDEVEGIFNYSYENLSCREVKENLSYITRDICQTCEVERGRIRTSLSEVILEYGNTEVKLAYYIEIEGITSVSELSELLGISRKTVYKKIEQLKNSGFLKSFQLRQRKQS